MLSSVFVDRPRLAIVIAIVTTIAGALALYSIPIAQFLPRSAGCCCGRITGRGEASWGW
jgi:hypothetical protein